VSDQTPKLSFMQSAHEVALAMTKMVTESKAKFDAHDLPIHLASLAGHLANECFKDDGERAAFTLDLIEELIKMAKVDAKTLMLILKEIQGGNARAH